MSDLVGRLLGKAEEYRAVASTLPPGFERDRCLEDVALLTEAAQALGGGPAVGRSWTCGICGRLRPDAKIAVASSSLGFLQVNVRYCTDSRACGLAAVERARTLSLRWGVI